MTRQRMKPADRKQSIELAAMEVCRHKGISKVTRKFVAIEADVAEGLVSHYFGTMKQLRRFITRKAMHDKDPVILSQMVSDPNFKSMLSSEHRQIAIAHITG